MKKLLLISLLFSLTSYGQTPMYKLLAKKASSCALLLDTYTGATAAYSLRLLDCDYAGNCIRVRRSSDNTESNIGFSGGNLDTASMKTFVGTGGTDDGFVVTWYDQSGNGNDATQSTAGNQAKIMDNGVIYREGANPTILFDGTSDYYSLTSTLASNADFSAFGVQSRASNVQLFALANTGNDQPYPWLQFIDGNCYITDGSNYVGGAYDVSGIRLFSGFRISATLTLYGNGGSISGLGAAIGGATTFNSIGRRNGTYTNGKISEVIYFPSDKSSSRTGIESNINTFYTIY